MMKIVELSQGSPQWLEWRRSGLGASDIPILIGSNKFRTPFQLWEDKCGFGEEIEMNAAMKHGVRNESIARDYLNEKHGYNLKGLCCEHDDHSYMKASLDGWDAEKKVLVEIKCPVSYERIEKMRTWNEVYTYWEDQILWQMMICDIKEAYAGIWDWKKQECFLVPIFYDPFRQNRMKELATNFYDMIVKGIPPELTEKDYKEIEDPELEKYIEEYKEIVKEVKDLKLKKEVLKEKIVSFGNDKSFIAYGSKIKKCSGGTRASYDIKKMIEDGIDVDKYKKISQSESGYKIIIPKN